MIRVLGGKWRGRQLKTPAGEQTRPSGSRLREALFNIITPQRLEGQYFYDLFAGSGAIGIEALSRSAGQVTFVESHREALRCLKSNLVMLCCENQTQVIRRPLPRVITEMQIDNPSQSIVFLDPPYGKNLAVQTLETLAENDKTTPQLCIAQVERKTQLADHYGKLVLQKNSHYGDSSLWIYQAEN